MVKGKLSCVLVGVIVDNELDMAQFESVNSKTYGLRTTWLIADSRQNCTLLFYFVSH